MQLGVVAGCTQGHRPRRRGPGRSVWWQGRPQGRAVLSRAAGATGLLVALLADAAWAGTLQMAPACVEHVGRAV